MIAGLCSALAITACTFDTEPSLPCGELDLGPVEARAADSQSPTILALADGEGHLKILRVCAGISAKCVAELEVQELNVNDDPDQILLTASGRWLTYRVGPNLFRVDLEAEELAPTGSAAKVHELVGALRGGDWLIYRSWAEVDAPEPGEQPPPVNESELWAYYVGDIEDLPAELGADGQPAATPIRPHFKLGEGLDLRVVGLGHRHVVARRLLGHGEEELYLIRVAPARRHDELGSTNRGKALLLARGQGFTQVAMTEGPSPAERGDPYEFQHAVPTDVSVIASTGGSTPHTLIFNVGDARRVANFEGAVVNAHADFEQIAGLSPISPSGTHLAYITPRGSLALRNLDTQQSCMIRPAASAEHELAGFGADGTLYFESLEGNASAVFAYDSRNREYTNLSKSDAVWRLKAVPPEPHVDEDGQAHPWAIVANDGFAPAGPGPGHGERLDYGDKVNFLPRGDETLWALEADVGGETFASVHRLSLRRIQPLAADARLRFEDSDPSVAVGADEPVPLERFAYEYTSSSSVCVTTSQATTRTTPWSSRCSTRERPTLYMRTGPPAGELE